MYTQTHTHTHAHAGTYRKVEGYWQEKKKKKQPNLNRPGDLYARKSREIALLWV